MFNFKEFQKYEINNILTKYINKINDYDNYFFKTRNKNKYLVSAKCNRKINTEFGICIFNQRIYWDKINKKYYYPIYEKFNIKKRAKIINDLKQEIINKIGQKKSYKNIQDELKFTYISKTIISKYYKNLEIKEILPKEKSFVKDNEYIYINADDCFVPVWNKNNKRELQKIRSISYNTGRKKISKNRYKLINKKYNFIFNHKTNPREDYYIDNNTVNFTWNGLNKYFEFENAKLVVTGDGATWIRNLTKYLNAYYVFDKYHALIYLWKIYKPNIGNSRKNYFK